MTILIWGLVLFFGVHVLPMTQLKPRLIAGMGERAWKGLFSLISLAGLALIIWGYWRTRSGPDAADFLWYPPDWTRHITMLLVLLGILSIAISMSKGRLRQMLGSPQSIGVALWAAGHLLANGKLASVLLFGSFLVYALADIAVTHWRANWRSYEVKRGGDAAAIIGGLAAYAFFLLIFHPYVLNLPIIR